MTSCKSLRLQTWRKCLVCVSRSIGDMIQASGLGRAGLVLPGCSFVPINKLYPSAPDSVLCSYHTGQELFPHPPCLVGSTLLKCSWNAENHSPGVQKEIHLFPHLLAPCYGSGSHPTSTTHSPSLFCNHSSQFLPMAANEPGLVFPRHNHSCTLPPCWNPNTGLFLDVWNPLLQDWRH